MLNAHNRSSITLWKDLTDIVLLGHSFAGTIIAKVAEAIPDCIRRLIFFDAFVLNDGESLLPHLQTLLDELARESDDHTMVMPFELWREVLLNDADLELARSSYARYHLNRINRGLTSGLEAVLLAAHS